MPPFAGDKIPSPTTSCDRAPNSAENCPRDTTTYSIGVGKANRSTACAAGGKCVVGDGTKEPGKGSIAYKYHHQHDRVYGL